MFDSKTTTSDILERLHLSEPKPAASATALVRDEIDALARTARKHPAGSGSALALVGLVAFGIGFLVGHADSSESVPRKRLFRQRPKRWPARTTHSGGVFSGRK
ncbi:hypothetical protein [Martelella endophytica]|uniref:Uncharacterized protein n=1 Tax=Martelella endophytica TaxID=1486262 RepID=A0A0D5LTW7_MAREN|nr:hypothetical protein [Martelella endophytica]AJY47664.1 hypothetical protein TM49_21505 [Martelella endophytica]